MFVNPLPCNSSFTEIYYRVIYQFLKELFNTIYPVMEITHFG
ncbi:hypothetical protein [Klebsiella michiganensis]|nr:hypothetical protein [Klebsiella michiganensis]WCA39469.1 hypothetical protein PHA56_29575 [Klebsiella michiganensis]